MPVRVQDWTVPGLIRDRTLLQAVVVVVLDEGLLVFIFYMGCAFDVGPSCVDIVGIGRVADRVGRRICYASSTRAAQFLVRVRVTQTGTESCI